MLILFQNKLVDLCENTPVSFDVSIESKTLLSSVTSVFGDAFSFFGTVRRAYAVLVLVDYYKLQGSAVNGTQSVVHVIYGQ